MITGTDQRMVLYGSSSTVVLENLISTPDWDMVDQLVHKALTGDKYIKEKGVYVKFDVKVNIYKTGNQSLAAVKAKFEEIYALRFDDFRVKPYYDGNIIKNSSNQDVYFHFRKFDPRVYNTPILEDYLLLSFESLSPYDISKSLVAV